MFKGKSSSKEKPPKVAAPEILKDCQKSGNMKKQGGSVKTWHKRYHILHQGKLYYFKGKSDQSPKGMVEISGLRCERADQELKDFSIKIISPARTYFFICESDQDANDWIKAINEAAAVGVKQLIHVVSNDSDNETKFHTIQEALDADESGRDDIIALRPGFYQLELNKDGNSSIYVNMNVEIKGVTPDRTALQLQADLDVPAIIIAAKGTDAIVVKSGNLVIENCDIKSTNGSAVRLCGNSTCSISNTILSENGEHAVSLQDHSSGKIEKCNFSDNLKACIIIRDNASCAVEHCVFKITKSSSLSGNQSDHYIHAESQQPVSVKFNTFFTNSNKIKPLKVEEGVCGVEISNNESK